MFLPILWQRELKFQLELVFAKTYFQKTARGVTERQVVSIYKLFISSKDNAFYTRHENDIDVIDMAWCYIIYSYSKGAYRLLSALEIGQRFVVSLQDEQAMSKFKMHAC
jgi:hypothetical protein